MYVDSHVNLHGERYAEDLAEVLTRAAEANVDAMLTISDRLDSLPEIEEISSAQQNIWHSVGVHPHHAKDYAALTAGELIARATHPKAIGIGECGLDLHYEYSEIDLQKPVFAAHIEAAIETKLPLIIHTRNADDHTGEMLREGQAQGSFTPLMHCYTVGWSLRNKPWKWADMLLFRALSPSKKLRTCGLLPKWSRLIVC